MGNDSQQWQKIFDGLVQMLKTQQTQLESLAEERKFLEDRIKVQRERWVSDIHHLKDHLSQMNVTLKEVEMDRLLAETKEDLMVGIKKRDVFFYKIKSERSKSDLEDMKMVLDLLAHKISEQKVKMEEADKEVENQKDGTGKLRSGNNAKEEESHSKSLREEIRRLKRTNEKLKSEKNAEVSALISERNFVWNQLKKIESYYINILKGKRDEVEEAKKTAEVLQLSMDKLQSSTEEKDEIILNLKADLVKHEMDAKKHTKEISRLSRELELLRSTSNAPSTPEVSCPKVVGSSNPPVRSENIHTSNHRIRCENNGRNKKQHPVEKEPDASQASDPAKNMDTGSKGNSKKRGRERETITKSATPRLFSASFKVPKLKNSPALMAR